MSVRATILERSSSSDWQRPRIGGLVAVIAFVVADIDVLLLLGSFACLVSVSAATDRVGCPSSRFWRLGRALDVWGNGLESS